MHPYFYYRTKVLVFQGALTQDVPVRKGQSTTEFEFSCTFTAEDAGFGKVTFKALAVLTSARDGMPFDNEVILFPTIVRAK